MKFQWIFSKLRPNFVSSLEYTITTFLSLIGVTYFALLQAIQKPCCDAVSYLNYGSSLLSNSFLIPPTENQPSDLRTFVYPVFLAWVIRIAKLLLIEPVILITIIQTVIYFLSATFLASKLHSKRLKVPRNIWIALMLNVFIWPYLSSTLTDSIYVSLFLLFLGICTEIYKKLEIDSGSIYLNTFYLVFCFAIMLELRPASIWLAPILTYLIYLQLKKHRNSISKQMIAIFFGLTPVFYQIYINLYLFSKFSPFPATNLGAMQINWGIKYLKYITWLGGGEPQGIYSSQELVGKVAENLTLNWYFENPLLSVKLLYIKLIGGFDFDFLVPYPQSRPWYSALVGVTSLAILLFGLLIIARFIFRKSRDAEKNFIPRYLPILIFMSWAAVTLISAIELRFTLPMITFFIILIANEGTPARGSSKRLLMKAIPLGLILLFFIRTAMYVRNQSSF